MDNKSVYERALNVVMTCRILIADDHAQLRKTLRQTLEAHPGWQVCGEATTGLEAVEKAAQLKPDVIILDLSMPVMGGLEAAPRILSIAPEIPILLFTSHFHGMLAAEAQKAGIRRVLSKDGTELLDTIEAVLDEKLSTAMETIQSEIPPTQNKTKLSTSSGDN